MLITETWFLRKCLGRADINPISKHQTPRYFSRDEQKQFLMNQRFPEKYPALRYLLETLEILNAKKSLAQY